MRALALALTLVACAGPLPRSPSPSPSSPPPVVDASTLDLQGDVSAFDAAVIDLPSVDVAGDGRVAAATDGPVVDASPDAPVEPGATRCVPQPAQSFLIRGHYMSGTPRQSVSRHQATIRYRTQNYGYFQGFGDARLNPHLPIHYAQNTTFAGRPVRLHARVVPALRCVEEEIAHACTAHPYRPFRLDGIRRFNSFHGGELSNHVYGIAIDIDPDRNPCCGCGRLFAGHPRCQRPSRNLFDRMAMPECWVHAFERYGFYWLGRDSLRDMMHFEFLGDPERILEQQADDRLSGTPQKSVSITQTSPPTPSP